MATFIMPWFTNYQFRSEIFHSNEKSKNAAFVNISSSLHLMLLFIPSACPLTISAMGKLFKVVRSRDSTSCHVIARDISRFHRVFLWTGYRYNFKSKHSNLKSKNATEEKNQQQRIL